MDLQQNSHAAAASNAAAVPPRTASISSTVPAAAAAAAPAPVSSPPPSSPLTAAVLDLHLMNGGSGSSLHGADYLLAEFVAPALERILLGLLVASSHSHSHLLPDNHKFQRWIIRTWTLPVVATFTLLVCRGQLPGTRLLNLRMVPTATATAAPPQQGSAVRRIFRSSNKMRVVVRLVLYAAVRYGLPALYQSLRHWLDQHKKRLEEALREEEELLSLSREHEQEQQQRYDASSTTTNTTQQQQQQRLLLQKRLALQRQCAVGTAFAPRRIRPCF